MVSQKVTIKNPTGLHLRPAGILCKEAMKYKASVTFQFKDTTANAKSVLSVLGACVKSGDEIEVFVYAEHFLVDKRGEDDEQRDDRAEAHDEPCLDGKLVHTVFPRFIMKYSVYPVGRRARNLQNL